MSVLGALIRLAEAGLLGSLLSSMTCE